MGRVTLLAIMVGAVVSGCTRETLQRTGYETLRNVEQQRCLEQGTMPCPPRQGYDDYQRQRQELESPQ